MFQLEAVQQLSHGAATISDDASAQEIHQKTVAKYGIELREELFNLGNTYIYSIIVTLFIVY